MASPRRNIPRSPGHVLLQSHKSNSEGDPMSRSQSGQSSSSQSTQPRPGVLRRRSTDASGGLDYYFSSLAGAGGSSSSSSLAISPSPSIVLAASPSSSPHLTHHMKSKSHGSLRELDQNHEAKAQDQDKTPSIPYRADPGPSNRKIQVLSYPSSGSLAGLGMEDPGDPSPGGWSASSRYSNERQSAVRTDSDGSDYSAEYRHLFRTQDGEARRGLMDASTIDGEVDWRDGNGQFDQARASMMSGSTVQPEVEEPLDPNERTPVPGARLDRMDLPTNRHGKASKHIPSPVPTPASPNRQTTPTRPVPSNEPSPASSHYTPSSGRLAFIASADVSRRSLDDLEREVEASDPEGRMDVRVSGGGGEREGTRSAPAWQAEFGPGRGSDDDEGDDTVKGKVRRTLPATTSTSSGAIVEAMLSPEKTFLSPDKYENRGTPSRQNSDEKGQGHSPQLPPRSSLRAQSVTSFPERNTTDALSPPAIVTDRQQTSPLRVSPRSARSSLPTIINTSSSPESAPRRPEVSPRRPSRSPDRTAPVLPNSTTINDLTEMLGGAIDAIGLIDSRDTPPPTITEPLKRDRPSTSGPLGPPAEVLDRDLAMPARGTTLPNPTTSPVYMMPPQITPRRSTLSLSLHKAPSMVSLQSHPQTTTVANVGPRPWPAAMLYGNVKVMKNAGERAKGYARAINELARAESGLREWCVASTAMGNRPVSRQPTKAGGVASLGLWASTTISQSSLPSLVVPEPTHARSVSASSEFPMRGDSYTAREISQRIIDPRDQPTSLPPTLPYPQVQQIHGGGISSSLKPSPSMQSVASFATSSSSKKHGFFHRLGGGKKESTGLGPPTSAAKKDIRGLPISNPTQTTGGSSSPQRIMADAPGSSSLGGGESGGGGGLTGGPGNLSAPRVQSSISAPIGPRPPRISHTPPPTSDRAPMDPPGRASLDASLSRMNRDTRPPDNLRVSGQKSSVPPPGTTNVAVREEGLKQMADVMPHVEKAVLRGYLAKYGEPMRAIGHYFEDEKKGTVMRA